MVFYCGALGGGIDDDYSGEGTGMDVSDFEQRSFHWTKVVSEIISS